MDSSDFPNNLPYLSSEIDVAAGIRKILIQLQTGQWWLKEGSCQLRWDGEVLLKAPTLPHYHSEQQNLLIRDFSMWDTALGAGLHIKMGQWEGRPESCPHSHIKPSPVHPKPHLS